MRYSAPGFLHKSADQMVEAKKWKDKVKGTGTGKDLKETHGNKGENRKGTEYMYCKGSRERNKEQGGRYDGLLRRHGEKFLLHEFGRNVHFLPRKPPAEL